MSSWEWDAQNDNPKSNPNNMPAGKAVTSTEVWKAKQWPHTHTHTHMYIHTLASFPRHIQINAQPDPEALVTNWRLGNYECSYILNSSRQSLDVSPAVESTLAIIVSLFKTWAARRGGVSHSALLPCAWQALSLQKVHLAPQLLKCKFEKKKENTTGVAHQHISLTEAGRLEDWVIS